MKRNDLRIIGDRRRHQPESVMPRDPRRSLTRLEVVKSWTDDDIEAMAASDAEHPPLDDAFWAQADIGPVEERSDEVIGRADLLRLSSLAIRTLDDLSRRLADRPSGLNRTRLRLMALGQGAAQHSFAGVGGIKDFDIWAFFEAGDGPPFPHRTIWRVDFGPSRFGAHPIDRAKGYGGRRVDIMGRSIRFEQGESTVAAVRRWLQSGTNSALHLAARPMIAIYPDAILGEIIQRPR